MKERSLPKDYQRHADVHGIAHVAVQAGDDEEFRGRDWCGRAEAAHRKLPRTEKVDGSSNNDAQEAQPRRRPADRRVCSTEQDVGNVHRDYSRDENREQKRFQDWC